jgi:hypothetical protein
MSGLTIPLPGDQLDREDVRAARLVMTQPEIDDNPAEWLAQRRGGEATGDWRVTASELAVVLGIAPASHGSAYSLYYDKTEGITTFAGNDRTDFGLFVEPFVAGRFASQHPELSVGPGGLYASREWPWLAATFDRIAYERGHDERCCGAADPGCPGRSRDPAGPVQIKSWAQRGDFGPAGSSVVPAYLRVQCLVEMTVLGTDLVWMPVLFLPGSRVETFVIERDADADADIAAILAAGEEFIRCLDEERPPEVDWRPSTTETLRHLYPGVDPGVSVRVPWRLGHRLTRAKAARDRAVQRVAQAQNEIRARAGNAGTVTCWDRAAGRVRVLVTRTAGPRAGSYTPPLDRVESMRGGPWGKPLTRAERGPE